ncbi:hypothetical protein EVAR_82995_1 [Eumeta japonica]|uniref:DUF1731 domain-containing protein n=1 Tax=Eumeta variegata TaxID=151549 RepID=A0A4C1VTA4_EUMVA|nr:hypothetical protein EVAR_82995_1 [Eumeta japonica]
MVDRNDQCKAKPQAKTSVIYHYIIHYIIFACGSALYRSISHRLTTAFLVRRSDVKTQTPAAASVGRAFAGALKRPAFIPVPERLLDIMFHPERAMMMTKGQHVTPQRVLEYGFQYQYSDINEACKEFAHLFPKKKSY